jgi:mRNA deadenylase 3'-5' endonuclease subunit Ccr4
LKLLVEEEEIKNVIGDKGLPNEFHPSDHLPLCCNFYFK